MTSYGGKLTYTVRFEIPQDTAAEGIVKADVRLEVWISYQLSSGVLYILPATENPSPLLEIIRQDIN